MSNEELNKPCPFCANTDVSRQHDDGLSWMKCNGCGATGPAHTRYSADDGDEIPEWNTRPQPADAPPVAEVPKDCPTCEGRGVVASVGYIDMRAYPEADTCPDCKGSGEVERVDRQQRADAAPGGGGEV